MYSYLYDNKFLLWTTIIFMFIGMITVTIILYIFFLSIVKRKKSKKEMEELLEILSTLKNNNRIERDKETKKLSETLSPYEFESTQLNYVNKSFNFEKYLYSGDYVKVIKAFKDYYGFTHQVGEKWYFASQYSLLSEYGDVLYISTDKINVDTIYLEDRKDNLYTHPEEYFEILEQGRFKREI
ncbi:DUF3601 domain-containing protein [Fusobacterium nucleatum subsp. nucleatum ATCC 23726]|uniref:DUF3601 domain-containing protein n=1 Tax=Fusobacterium nucleatum subsp. nucleatum (strain ATCC 23726 / VPI 4351) TaxID=525283 RepID=D5RAF3_FUSN2|nr:DUF3601 domain-containing protein [Fusobacterium nucleatum]AVQ23312.1 DUF3601 domain-containing protein [Fusobacterium nucleatum subsp. nucleatum ATCC 23726]EFG96231.1 hypothetical protein HMPREF0397_0188 [Fusobacterium nucleatum subsp. nucleatum ATCC 23726]ERT42139.1 hypothetical protein HMPREF1539_01649 [Fusobacterium nucleatum CTI-2]MCG6843706.1 DUF3601 domain-containing protein [Fusobacterium nucleatum]